MSDDAYGTLIVGGGPAGAALAAELASAGRDVVLVEREAGPHDKVCGEFLSAPAIAMLARLGLDVEAFGAVPIDRVELSRGRWRIERSLPFRAASLSRRILDEALLAHAEAAGARVLRGAPVRELVAVNGRWRARLAQGSIEARQAVLATGKHDVRGHSRPAGRHDDLIGFKAHLRLSAHARAELAGKVEIALFPGGYAGLEPIEGGRANLCLVVGQSAFAETGGGWNGTFDRVRVASASFANLLDGAEPLFERPLAISRIPYGLVRATAAGPWLIGDQAAVIPSFAGEGLSFALHGARLAARHMIEGRSAAEFQASLAADLSSQIRLATTLSRLIVRPTVQRLAPLFAPTMITWLAGATRLKRAASDRDSRSFPIDAALQR